MTDATGMSDASAVPYEDTLAMSASFRVSAIRRFTVRWRALPDFIIVGAQKCGTSSLQHHLGRHPQIRPASKKEVHFFDLGYPRGLDWYRAHFPMRSSGMMTGEATPYYMFHPCAAERLAEHVPKARLIILVRDPIKRAYSHYQHNVRLGHEPLSFADAIDAEAERLEGEEERIRHDPSYISFRHRKYSYISRGMYMPQIKRLAAHFNRDQLLVLDCAELFQSPEVAYRKATDFLSLQSWTPTDFKARNVGGYEKKIEPALVERLQTLFNGPNRDLAAFADIDFNH